MSTDLTLRQFLTLVIGQGAILGPFVFLIFEKLSLGQTLSPAWKRVLVGIVSALCGLFLWALALSLGYVELGEGRDALAEALWRYGVMTGVVAFLSANITHGFLKLPSVKGFTLATGDPLIPVVTLDQVEALVAAHLPAPAVAPSVSAPEHDPDGTDVPVVEAATEVAIPVDVHATESVLTPEDAQRLVQELTAFLDRQSHPQVVVTSPTSDGGV